MSIRHDWSRSEIQALYDQPLLELVFQAAVIHRRHHDPREVQVCRLISIKTGACPEDCAYCSQSARYHTAVKPEPLMDKAHVLEIASRAKATGATRVCMGAAWRNVKDNRQFDQVLDMVRGVNAMGMEVCCTLGMLSEDQARRLADAGLYAYNHNLDTSREYYHKVITTRTYDDRLNTIKNVRKTDITVCCGGILGLGESPEDRVSLLHTLSTMDPHPESVPINLLAQVPGTPMEHQENVPAADLVRMVAVARILMPRATVRLSAGRNRLSTSDQALCFLAGANSLFSSDEHKMLTEAAPSPDYDADHALLDQLGLKMRPPFKPYVAEDNAPHPHHADSGHCSHCGCGHADQAVDESAADAVAEPVG